MIPAKIIELIFKAFFKHPKIMELFKYKDEPNELDIGFVKIKKDFDSMQFKVNAMRDLFKDIQGQIEAVKNIAHAPKDFTKQIDAVKTDIINVKSSVKGFSDIFKKMKKLPLLRSIFK